MFYGGLAGQSYVVFGKASGFAATIALSSLDGTNGFSLTGGTGEGSGFSVALAGDVNGDGGTDLIVGSWAGTSHVVFGEAPADTTVNQFGAGALDVLRGGLSDDNLAGLGGNDRPYAFAGDDVLSGGNGDDVLAGGAGDDALVGGSGTDTAYYAAETAGVTANLATGQASGASTGVDGRITSTDAVTVARA